MGFGFFLGSSSVQPLLRGNGLRVGLQVGLQVGLRVLAQWLSRMLNNMLNGRRAIALPVLCLLLLGITGCTLPRVNAEERLFLPLAVDFLGEYRLPPQEFEGAPVGGLSGLAYDRQRDRLYALSDDRSNFGPARFYTLHLTLDQSEPANPRIGSVEVESVTPLLDEDGQPFAAGTVDPEAIALTPRQTVYIASEGIPSQNIPPFIDEFDLETGRRKSRLKLPERYLPAAADAPSKGVQENLGFESLTPDPSALGTAGYLEPFRLFAATESSLLQDLDAGPSGELPPLRLLHYLIGKDQATLLAEHLYYRDALPPEQGEPGLTELLAIDAGGQFLSLERAFTPQTGVTAQLFQMVMGNATDTSGMPQLQGDLSSIQPVRKRRLLNLGDLGIRLDNLEAMTLGPRLPDGSTTLLLVSDDNFNPLQVTQFLLFRLR
ncbi:esterase-like activity of phytase family protein [Thermoleptolyngbya sp. M55_K2018_002]|uniref:esterase-like activity of phytase family protein n=1 Tax=Thermoleptolyngbya sp. M55_K2018_002 TaxID=2747808 RepID=UPI0025E337F4|nr:esterase-like activity of phytase family protein [Thermoleptolyngbya sp. M55_K2018_002]